MRQPISLAGLFLCLAFAGAAKDKIYLNIRAVTHTEEVWSRGSASTNCSGSATGTTANIGGITTETAMGESSCQTTPAPTVRVVTNVVEANGQRYRITCRARWTGSNCTPMTDGDVYSAEIGGTTMWVQGREGGNQGKQIRVKYKILDIRPVTGSQQSLEDRTR